MPSPEPDPNPAPRRYLVTGAGSGIGLAVVKALAARGHTVIAGARRVDDLAHLATLAGVQPLALDVRSAADAERARDTLAAGEGGLHGLVHSAGIGELGHLAAWSDADVQRLFETNVFGLMRLTRELLPSLIAAQGRVVIIGSMGGSITQPLYGPYTMSKFALEAYSECLRQELAPFGAAVSIVQPGAVATRIGAAAQDANEARLAATPPPFDAEAQRVLAAWRETSPPPRPDEPESASNRRPATAESVAEVVLQALFDAAPPGRYLVGTRWEGERVLDALITRLIDAAHSPGQQLTQQDLVARLEAAWQSRSGGRR